MEKIENRTDIKIRVGGMGGEADHLSGSVDATNIDTLLLV